MPSHMFVTMEFLGLFKDNAVYDINIYHSKLIFSSKIKKSNRQKTHTRDKSTNRVDYLSGKNLF